MSVLSLLPSSGSSALLGGVTTARLLTICSGLRGAVTVNAKLTVELAGMLTSASTVSTPLAEHTAPAVAVHVQLALLSCGRMSVTRALTTVCCPALLTSRM